MRMEALFQIGEYGPSMSHAYEGMRHHRAIFAHGVYQAKETLEDCIGRNTSPIALLLLYPWIRNLWQHRKYLIIKEMENNELEGVYRDQSTGGQTILARDISSPASTRRVLDEYSRIMAREQSSRSGAH